MFLYSCLGTGSSLVIHGYVVRLFLSLFWKIVLSVCVFFVCCEKHSPPTFHDQIRNEKNMNNPNRNAFATLSQHFLMRWLGHWLGHCRWWPPPAKPTLEAPTINPAMASVPKKFNGNHIRFRVRSRWMETDWKRIQTAKSLGVTFFSSTMLQLNSSEFPSFRRILQCRQGREDVRCFARFSASAWAKGDVKLRMLNQLPQNRRKPEVH